MERNIGTGVRWSGNDAFDGIVTDERPKRRQRQQQEGAQAPRLRERPAPQPTGPRRKLSFFTGIVTAAGKPPKFIGEAVPLRLETPVVYWYAFDKQDTNTGDPITVWYCYEQGDGPYSDARFGDKFTDGATFWAVRKGIKDPNNPSYVVSYPDDMVRMRDMKTSLRWAGGLNPRQSGQRSGRSSGRASGFVSSTASGRSSGFTTPGVSFASAVSGAASSAGSRAASPPPLPVDSVVKAAMLLGRTTERVGGIFTTADVTELASAMADNGFTVVEKKKKKKKQSQSAVNSEPSSDVESKPRRQQKDQSELPQYLRNVPVGTKPSEVFGECRDCCCTDGAWNLSKNLFPTRSFVRSHGKVQISGMNAGAINVNYQVKFVIKSDMAEQLVKWLAHTDQQLPQPLAEFEAVYNSAKASCCSNKPDVVVEKEEFPPLTTSTNDWAAVMDKVEPLEQRQVAQNGFGQLKQLTKVESPFSSSTPSESTTSVKLSSTPEQVL